MVEATGFWFLNLRSGGRPCGRTCPGDAIQRARKRGPSPGASGGCALRHGPGSGYSGGRRLIWVNQCNERAVFFARFSAGLSPATRHHAGDADNSGPPDGGRPPKG